MINTILNYSIILLGLIIAFVIISIFLMSDNNEKVEKLTIINNPQNITFNNSIKLKIKGVNSNNEEIKLDSIKWKASQGGTIDNKGTFTANNQKQKVKITASVNQVKTTIEIEIIEPKLKVFQLTTPQQIARPGDTIKLFLDCKDQLDYPLQVGNITWSQNSAYTINSLGNLSFKTQAKGEYTIKVTATKYNQSDFVNINVVPVLTTLKINPQSLAIKPEEKYEFTVKGYDQCGETLDIQIVQWSCNRGGRINSSTGIFIGSYEERKATIIAQVNGIEDSIVIDLLPVLCKFRINPNNLNIEPNKKVQFKATGLDQFGNEITLINTQWYADKGNIDDYGNYQALGYETEVKITVKSDKITSSAKLFIRKPSVLNELIIRPNYISILPSETHHFKLEGLDQRNERMPISGEIWSANEGEIDQSGHYSSSHTQQGYDQIKATVNNLTATAQVYIPPVLQSIKVEPDTIKLYPEQEFQFTVTGYNQQNNIMVISAVTWKSEFGGNIDSNGVFTGGYQKREVIVTARINDLTAKAKVTVKPILRRLVISPEWTVLYPQETQQFTIKGYDQFENEIDAGIIYWESEGGEINENGLYQAYYYDKGIYKITSTSNYSPKYNRTIRKTFLTTAVGMKILGWVISPNHNILEIIEYLLNGKNFPQLPESQLNQQIGNNNLLSTTEATEVDTIESLNSVEDNVSTGNIISTDNVSGGNVTLDNPFSDWLFHSIRKQVSKFFSSIGKFCLNEANKYVNASAKVEVLPALRSIVITPNNPTLISGETIKLDVLGLDQHNENYLALEKNLVEWETNAGQIFADGTLSLEESKEKEPLKSISVTARVNNLETSVEVSVDDQPDLSNNENYLTREENLVEWRKKAGEISLYEDYIDDVISYFEYKNDHLDQLD